MEISELLSFARKNKASDLHVISNHPPMLRINGDIVPVRINALSPEEVITMLHSIMHERQRIEYEENYEVDFAINFASEGRFRANAFTTIHGPAVAFRSIPSKVETIEALRLPKILENFAYLNKGLVLVTGPTGSGKSTTLAAIIDHINQNQSRHIITIEDPIEFVHRSSHCLINQREVGTHTKSFASALKNSLREDPDVILVGELRDLETVRLALTAAETGHLVFATLHTSSASKTIDRIIDVFPDGDKAMARTMLAGSLEAIVSQLLVKTADGTGRIAVNEVLLANSAVRNLIRDNKIPQIYSIMQVSSKIGMKVMKDSVYELMKEEIITADEARRILNFDPSQQQEEDGSRKSGGGF
jgi:twitching motility protein PilT